MSEVMKFRISWESNETTFLELLLFCSSCSSTRVIDKRAVQYMAIVILSLSLTINDFV